VNVRYPRGSVARTFAQPEDWGAETPGRQRGGNHTSPHTDWRDRCVKLAAQRGWLCAYWTDSRKSPPGFPDICAVHAGQGRILFIECKTGTGRLSDYQQLWRDELLAAGQEWHCLWPHEEPTLITLLEGAA
jgi:hypothetical protein